MNKSQFEAGTFGVGELITQRKLFRVPPHQRSYAWDRDAVNAFLSDVEQAFVSNASEYFVGLVVIQGPEDGEWTLLDGQQRLTTSTIIFASIRNWLAENGMLDDSRQIETEFLGVRRLGGEYSSRMQLNEDNQETFRKAVITPADGVLLKQLQLQLGKKSSNRLLVDAALECQRWVGALSLTGSGTARDRAERLFRLSAFLESKVKVVCVEISNDVDPYILFESLNDRGVELSALDLLKNYAYSKSTTNSARQFDQQWERLVEQLDDRNPDDFLKVSWTAAHGLVQKTQLFRNIRKGYRSQGEVLEFLGSLTRDARVLSAIEDPSDSLWTDYPPAVKDHILTLNTLGGRQVRSVALAAVSNLTPADVEALLWYLIVVVVRFQIIGRGRTGIMEKVFGRMCVDISNGVLKYPHHFEEALSELWISDEEFSNLFATHTDSKYGRFKYFLAQMELYLQPELGSVEAIFAVSNLIEIEKRSLEPDPDARLVGEFALIDTVSSRDLSIASVLAASRFRTTNMSAMHWSEDRNESTHLRSSSLGSLAPSTWAFNR